MRSRYGLICGILLLVIVGFTTQLGYAQSQPTSVAQAPPTPNVLFENVRIFNGTSEQLSAPSNVLIVDNKIQTISTDSIAAPSSDLTRINGGGRVLMPGLIDNHTHLLMATSTIEQALSPDTDPEVLKQNSEQMATDTLLRGFTSVRDLAGPVFDLKQMDEATAQIMAEKGIWLSMQPFLDDEDAIPFPEGSENRAKQLQMTQGTDNAYALAKKHNLKTAWGTDTLFDAKLATRQGAQLAKMVRWYNPFEVLKMATSTNAELLALSGPRSPYAGKLGVVEEGALADLLLVDGNPLENIRLIEEPNKNFTVIMKDGKIYKNANR